MDDVELLYYVWSFDEKIKIIPSEKIEITKYDKYISLNSSKVILNINKQKISKNYIINKTIDLNYVEKADVIYYCLISIIGFMAGLVIIRYIGLFSNKILYR